MDITTRHQLRSTTSILFSLYSSKINNIISTSFLRSLATFLAHSLLRYRLKFHVRPFVWIDDPFSFPTCPNKSPTILLLRSTLLLSSPPQTRAARTRMSARGLCLTRNRSALVILCSPIVTFPRSRYFISSSDKFCDRRLADGTCTPSRQSRGLADRANLRPSAKPPAAPRRHAPAPSCDYIPLMAPPVRGALLRFKTFSSCRTPSHLPRSLRRHSVLSSPSGLRHPRSRHRRCPRASPSPRAVTCVTSCAQTASLPPTSRPLNRPTLLA